MNTVKDLREMLSANTIRHQPPAGLEARVLRAAFSASEPLTARSPKQAISHRAWRSPSVKVSGLIPIVAALLALAIVLSLVFAARALRPIGGAPASRGYPSAVGQGGVSVSFEADPVFLSSNVGWGIAMSPDGRTSLYRTGDGGHHWSPALGWVGSGPVSGYPPGKAVMSPDGRQILLVSSERTPSVLFTSDGGRHWNRTGLPASPCATLQSCAEPLVDFVTPAEGWILWPEANVAEMFHSADSGAHWSRSAVIDTVTTFKALNGSLGGARLVFQSPSVGWLVSSWTRAGAANQLVAYQTTNGGTSWKVVYLPTPKGLDTSNVPTGLASRNLDIVKLKFFNDRDGVLELAQNPWYTTCQIYLYTTSDGGHTWVGPNVVPQPIVWNEGPSSLPPDLGGFDFIDTTHWIAYTGAGDLLSTDDGGARWNTVTPAAGQLELQSQYGPRLYFAVPSHGWLSSDLGLFGTSDSGRHWVRLTSPGG